MTQLTHNSIGLRGHVAWARPSHDASGARPHDAAATCATVRDGRLRILVADDNRDAADTLSALLGLWGHEVRVAYDGTTALQMASADQPDVLVLDIAMPNMDGYDLAERIRRLSRFRETLLIAITGYADGAHHRRGTAAGFDHYLAKPIDPATLESLLMREKQKLATFRESPHSAPPTYGLLVVDDDTLVRGLMTAGMGQHGFAVWVAADGREAVDIYQYHRAEIDVVLLDVCMPGLDGPETLAELRAIDPEVRCCFMSGGLGCYTAEGLRALGAAAVLPKPFRLTEVARVLREVAGPAGDHRPADELVAAACSPANQHPEA